MNASLLLGCLAPGWVIDMSYHIAYWGVVLSAAAALLSSVVEWRRGTFHWLPIYAALLVPHPGWRLAWHELHEGVRAVSSDCGYGNRFIATALLLATVSVLLLVLFRPGFSRRLYLVLLAAACWALHLATYVFLRPPVVEFLPGTIFGSKLAQEWVPAIDFGQARMFPFSIVLALLCIALYIPWHHVRRPNAV